MTGRVLLLEMVIWGGSVRFVGQAGKAGQVTLRPSFIRTWNSLMYVAGGRGMDGFEGIISGSRLTSYSPCFSGVRILG